MKTLSSPAHSTVCAIRNRLLVSLSLLLVSAPGITQSAKDTEERWYQVEIIAFARRDVQNEQEQWPENIQLRYPFHWEALKSPEATATETTSTEDETHEISVDLLRTPYYLLPPEDRQLNRHAASLNRNARYRVLLHQAWRQPVLEQDKAPSILISGGDSYGSHYELEGSINLNISRFLHLHTQLWLTRFEANYGQSPGPWPELPRRPDAVMTSTESDTGSDLWLTPSPAPSWETTSLTENWLEIPDFLGEPYLPNRIVLLDQRRRMRSNELHYLDHPLFGIIVQITPYQLPSQ